MPLQSSNHSAHRLTGFLAAFLLVASFGHAQDANPFMKLSGSWTGSGSIFLSNGTKERIRCRASYTTAEIFNFMSLRLEIRCESDSYNFELGSDINYNDGAISGVWSEMTRGVSGKITGIAAGDRIQAVAESPTLQAILEMATRGDRQSIRLQSPGSEMSEALITLNRSAK